MAKNTGASISRPNLRTIQGVQNEVLSEKNAFSLPGIIISLEKLNFALTLRHSAIEASAHPMIVTSAIAPDFNIEYVNPAFERITGYWNAEVIGKNCKFLQGTDQNQPELEEIRAALREQREGNSVLRNYRKDGSIFWNHLYVAPVSNNQGIVTHFVASHYDITVAKNNEAKLMRMAYHDELTGLPNRALLRDRLLQALALAARYSSQVWVLFISLNRFKTVNHSFGHKGSDSVLMIIAHRLRDAIRESDTLARWGDDEFVIVMPEKPAGKLAIAVLQRMIAVVNRAIVFGGQEFFLNCSMGVTRYPQDGEHVDMLLDRADIAAHHAKRKGDNDFQFHTVDMSKLALKRLRIEADLRLAIEREEFVLHYQPQVDLGSGFINGMEALIRWQHPKQGLLYPADFIDIAEETGLIIPIGAWVLRAACTQNKQWQEEGLPSIKVAVNLSLRQFTQQNLAQSFAEILDDIGLSPKELELELTESLIMSNVDQAIAVLRDIKALGVAISVDDFGTGYSSLSYLKLLPIDMLKIDRTFVSDIGAGDGDDAYIVTSIITLAHALKLRVIAEGVETLQQLNYLRRNGCDEMQGYFFSKPLSAEAFAQILRSGKRLPLYRTLRNSIL
ncbi:putative bifunctional diguanylate cyclase/phosphodiesterase [Glaciimonas sp. GNP009]